MLGDKINFSKLQDLVDDLKKHIALLNQRVTKYKQNIRNDDYEYIKAFETSIGENIYNLHKENKLNFCSFCKGLKKSSCHEHCFSCSKEYYSECGLLLPGIFSFMSNYPDSDGNETMPWTLIPGCKYFEQLDRENYFDNFLSLEQSVTVAFYEAVEGLYLGISRGKKPCHICASVNIEIYNSCCSSENIHDNKPCLKIFDNVVEYF